MYSLGNDNVSDNRFPPCSSHKLSVPPRTVMSFGPLNSYSLDILFVTMPTTLYFCKGPPKFPTNPGFSQANRSQEVVNSFSWPTSQLCSAWIRKCRNAWLVLEMSSTAAFRPRKEHVQESNPKSTNFHKPQRVSWSRVLHHSFSHPVSGSVQETSQVGQCNVYYDHNHEDHENIPHRWCKLGCVLRLGMAIASMSNASGCYCFSQKFRLSWESRFDILQQLSKRTRLQFQYLSAA